MEMTLVQLASLPHHSLQSMCHTSPELSSIQGCVCGSFKFQISFTSPSMESVRQPFMAMFGFMSQSTDVCCRCTKVCRISKMKDGNGCSLQGNAWGKNFAHCAGDSRDREDEKVMRVFFWYGTDTRAYHSAVCSPHWRLRQVLAAPLPAWPRTLFLRPQDPGSYPPGPVDTVALSGAQPQRGGRKRKMPTIESPHHIVPRSSYR